MFSNTQNFPISSSYSQDEAIERISELLDDYGKVQTRKLPSGGNLVVKAKNFSGFFYTSYLHINLKWRKHSDNYSITITPKTNMGMLGWVVLIPLLFSSLIAFIFPPYLIFVILWLSFLILRPYARSRKLKEEAAGMKEEIGQLLYTYV